MYISDPKLKEKIKILIERRKLFHLAAYQTVLGFVQYKIVQGRHQNMRGKISSALYGDCTLIAGDMTFKWGDCTGLVGDFTGLSLGNVREMKPKIFVQKMETPPKGFVSGTSN